MNIKRACQSLYFFVLFISLSTLLSCKKKEKEEKPRPTISFTFSNNIGTAPVNVSFSAAVANSSGVTWDFGDGQTGTGASINHIYNKQGFFEVIASTTSSEGITASQTRYVNVSPYNQISISQIKISVPSTKPDGSTTWDAAPGETPPDLYCDIYNSSGVKITNSSIYLNNSFSGFYEIAPSAIITDFYGKFTVKVFDYDLGGPDELISTFDFIPGEYFSSTLPFVGTFSKTNAGSSAIVYLSWN
jgi:hypothetical protein